MSLSTLALTRTVENIENLNILPKRTWLDILHSLVPIPKTWSMNNFISLVNKAYIYHKKKIQENPHLSQYRCTKLDVTIEVLYLFQKNSMENDPEYYAEAPERNIYFNVISSSIIDKINNTHFTEDPSNLVDIIIQDADFDYDVVHQQLHTIMNKAMQKNKDLTYTNAGLYLEDIIAVMSDMDLGG